VLHHVPWPIYREPRRIKKREATGTAAVAFGVGVMTGSSVAACPPVSLPLKLEPLFQF
jgi:hypothetical protein